MLERCLDFPGPAQEDAAKRVVGQKLTVRDTENLVRQLLSGKTVKRKTPAHVDPGRAGSAAKTNGSLRCQRTD
jgi:ParB-like chromosome segregation protein Spo0J